jgi:DNA-binding CsgD family transcriptional regulator
MSTIESTPAHPLYGAKVSAAELRVLQAISSGHSSKEVANILFLSKRTVDLHLGKVYAKLGVKNRLSALNSLSKLGILPFER